MRVMVSAKATADSEKDIKPTPETKAAMAEMAEMEKFNDALRKAGILRMAEGLRVSAHGKRVAFGGAGRTVSDGSVPIRASWSPASGSERSRTWTRPSSG